MTSGRYFALLLTVVSCHSPRTETTTPKTTVGAATSAKEEPLLAQPAALATAQGAGPLEVVARGPHIPGDSPGGFALLAAGDCALLLARGSSTVLDIDLYAFADDGTELGRDEAPDRDPALVVCATRPTRIFVAARVAQGSGLVSVGLQRLPDDRTDAVLKALDRRDAKPAAATVWPELGPLLVEHRMDIGGDWQDQRRVAVPIDSRLPSNLSATIPKNRCLDALVVTNDDVRQLDVELLDDKGRIFMRAIPLGRTPFAVVCSGDLDGTISIQLRPHSGRGNAVVLLSQTTSPAARQELHPEAGAVDLIPPALIHPTGTATPTRRALATSRTTKQHLELSVGQLSLRALPVQGCSRLDFTPRAPLIGQHTSVHDASGGLVGTVSSLAPSTLFVCAQDPVRGPAESSGSPSAGPLGRALSASDAQHPAREVLRLALEATRRGGPLDLEITPFADAPRSLNALPLAASRLLGVASDLGLLSQPAEIGRVTELSLETDRLTRLQFSAPALHCLTLMVALDRGARGLSVTAIDSSTGLVLDHQTGALAGSIRVCGDTGGTRQFVVELQTTEAPTRALIATRQAPLSPATPARRP